MKIGIFTDSYSPEINGVATSLQLLMNALHRRGHEVFVFAPNSHLKKGRSSDMHTRLYPSVLILGKQVRLSIPIIRAGVVAPLKLDVIHVHTPGPIGMAGARVGKKLKIPLVFTYHTRVESYAHYYLHLPVWLENGALALAARRFYDKYDAVIAPSEGIKKELEKYVRKPVSVIPTGADIEANREAASKNDPAEILGKYNLKAGDDLMITAGRLGKEKNIRFIIDAFSKIKASCPDAKLLIVGDGPDKEALMRYVRKKAGGRGIIFLDFLEHGKLFSLYRAMKVFLFASLTETQGLAILEAMSMGLPVVALSATGVEDLMAGDMGGFMTGHDLADFAQKTAELLQSKALWETKRQEAMRRAQDFSEEKVTQKIVELYRNVVQNKEK